LYLKQPALYLPAPKQSTKLTLYENIIKKAYNQENMNNSIILEHQKSELDNSEMRLLNMMLNMRGSFNLENGTPMISRTTQTNEPAIVTKQKTKQERNA
jgi:hypothetical protein